MVHTLDMQDAFGYVLFGVVIVGTIGAVFTFFMSGKAYDQIGKGGFFRDEGARQDAPINLAERDEEIRQMLTARNGRREAAGLEPVDIEEELSRLVAPNIDAQLRSEIREHVVARNNRRIRRGQEPLDVDSEVARAIEELG
jgi:hypothetical protein